MVIARWSGVVLVVLLIVTSPWARAADDTARFNGNWKGAVPYNGKMLTIVSVHDGTSYVNFGVTAQGVGPAGSGRFSAADGKWTVTSQQGNDSGTYQFTDDNTAVCKDLAGITVVWRRDATPVCMATEAPPELDPAVRADIESKMAGGDYDGALVVLNQLHAANSADPFLCINHARLMLRMENHRQARAEMTLFLQHAFENADAFVVHAQACAAMGDLRWAEQDLALAARLAPTSADRNSIAAYAALQPAGFGAGELPEQSAALIKMAEERRPYEQLVTQALRLVKGEYNVRRVEADDYREHKRQLVAAAMGKPLDAQPLAEISAFLAQQADVIHGEARDGKGIVAYRFAEPDFERHQAVSCGDAALYFDPKNVKAMVGRAQALIGLGREEDGRVVIGHALAINPNDPELLRMFSQLATRRASDEIDESIRRSTPDMWEDDQYYYIRRRSDEDLAAARRLDAAGGAENTASADALQGAVELTKGTASCYYYQAVQCIRAKDNAGGAAAMEQAVRLAPDNVEYRDMLAHFYGRMGWRKETEFFTQWSLADNLSETSASKMLRLAYKQLRRAEYDSARQSIAEAIRIDPADPRGPAYMGFLLAGENRGGGRDSEATGWLVAASALEEAQLRLWGVRHATPGILYTPDQIGLEEALALAAGDSLMHSGRPAEAAAILRAAIDAANRVDRTRWPYRVPTAMLPTVSVQGTPAPHMDPVKAAPTFTTTTLVLSLHELAARAYQACGQPDEAARERAAVQAMNDARRNAPPPPMRR